MKKLNTEYWKKLLETVAFSNGEISLYELVQKEHRHFHPSGDLTPSRTDINLTKSFQRIFDALGINFLDHIIIGGINHISLRNEGYMGEEKRYIQKSDFHVVSTSQLAMSAEIIEGYERE